MALNEHRYIDYTFDWIEFEKMAKKRFPSLKDAYKYVALFYLFGIKTPFTILARIFSPPEGEAKFLLSLHGMSENEPVIVERRERAPFDWQKSSAEDQYIKLFLELFFEKTQLEKNDVMAEIIEKRVIRWMLRSRMIPDAAIRQ